ncbi:MAG: NAD(P)H-dependent oxidoreductase [Bacillota bacterium]|nr:NAD(P)H-dependent oxidoreductase [Bacillota bacterium]
MEKLILINPFCPEYAKRERLRQIIEYSMRGYDYIELTTVEEVEQADLTNRRILFTVSLGESGINLSWSGIMKYLRLNLTSLEGSVGGVIVDGNSEMFTKSTGRSLVFTANMAGCTFPGRPLVEGTGSLFNYNIQAMNSETDNFSAYLNAGRILVENIMSYEFKVKKDSELLVVHASDRKTSNSLALWDMISANLTDIRIREISLRNGTIWDCRGCAYETCRHFGEENKCFYGGNIEKEVYPAILETDAICLVCPNYNDAMGGNLTAFVNRLTALFTTHRFYDKKVFAVIVSGYSGGDIVAEQIISGLNMNKTFALPGRFAIMETANAPRAILESQGIRDRAKTFASNITATLAGGYTND